MLPLRTPESRRSEGRGVSGVGCGLDVLVWYFFRLNYYLCVCPRTAIETIACTFIHSLYFNVLSIYILCIYKLTSYMISLYLYMYMFVRPPARPLLT